MKKILLLISFITISCGPKISFSNRETIDVSSPELNKITNAEIGVTLVTRETGYKYRALQVNEDRKVKPGNFAYKFFKLKFSVIPSFALFITKFNHS